MEGHGGDEVEIKVITSNKARCRKCGETIESKHRYDLQKCACGNFVDGGLDYLRRGGNIKDLEELSINVPVPWEEQGG